MYSSKLLNKLQIFQIRCIRIISSLPKLSNTEAYERKLDLLPLIQRSALRILQFAFDRVRTNSQLLSNTSQFPQIVLNDAFIHSIHVKLGPKCPPQN